MGYGCSKSAKGCFFGVFTVECKALGHVQHLGCQRITETDMTLYVPSV